MDGEQPIEAPGPALPRFSALRLAGAPDRASQSSIQAPALSNAIVGHSVPSILRFIGFAKRLKLSQYFRHSQLRASLSRRHFPGNRPRHVVLLLFKAPAF